ncbi:hypothetical protein CPU12_02140 [Malaciobacter molluscorum LMG 25693]|uniref:Response regulatory domain-containing protein n=1 Tax=Malaciobacter molluscorum LMG 25693 TaxID=870501 RepID=A0A2G1DKP2_9BACT|nr:hypothetical protein [Malaciobacter molluscorum]AXX92646.1 hypothetical protein AMOL_1681 [Malaciobacter molluscorum LMG 25693]PHO19068.1 hypothetical protein CPU12_02140 [Malaciobacter molluscorum LMG 25693]RXJ97374.1 hypothetical protein CRV00_00625 [Malaciobacter molluscorum]
MNIVTFCNFDESLIDNKHQVENFDSGVSNKADIAILDINSIFDFEENKHEVCKEKFVSIAVIDDDSDYDAFKNFGIDAWIKGEDVQDINGIINLVEKRFLS